jgi:hypothetical protein
MLGVITLLEEPLAAKFHPPGRGNHGYGSNVLVLVKVPDVVDLINDSRTSGSKIST